MGAVRGAPGLAGAVVGPARAAAPAGAVVNLLAVLETVHEAQIAPDDVADF